MAAPSGSLQWPTRCGRERSSAAGDAAGLIVLRNCLLTNQRHGNLRFTTPTDSIVATRSNVAVEIFRSITRTVLFDHPAALSSMNRVDDTSDACARSPARSIACCKTIKLPRQSEADAGP